MSNVGAIWLLRQERDQAREQLVLARRDVNDLLALALRLLAKRRGDSHSPLGGQRSQPMTAAEFLRESIYKAALKQQIAQKEAKAIVQFELPKAA